jgi:hypothetical protein
MRVEAEMGMKSLRGWMRGFLEFGLVGDEMLYARELRALRTQITRVIAELEKLDVEVTGMVVCGVRVPSAGLDIGGAGANAPVAEVT